MSRASPPRLSLRSTASCWRTSAIRAQITLLPTETLPLEQCIGQTLRQDVFAERQRTSESIEKVIRQRGA
jgi:hypothetical protein